MWLALLVCLGLALGGAQLIRPTMKDPPHEPLLQGSIMSKDVAGIFERACQDCHSNNTRWPWYAKVTPVSFLVAQDVERGRRFLNLSRWQNYSHGQKLGYLATMTAATSDQKMPPKMYTVLHSDARLSGAERQLIANWAREERARLRRP
jgi:hypothetical protein